MLLLPYVATVSFGRCFGRGKMHKLIYLEQTALLEYSTFDLPSMVIINHAALSLLFHNRSDCVHMNSTASLPRGQSSKEGTRRVDYRCKDRGCC